MHRCVHGVNDPLDVHVVNAITHLIISMGQGSMLQSAPGQADSRDGAENERVLLGLLQSVERDGAKSQRRLAAELGIALGLVNAYIKRCVKKGLMKASSAPAGRYAYYLTPRGFAEKSQLTAEYLSYSFSFFRAAKSDCAAAIDAARTRGFTRLVLAGRSDLAEIAAICALQKGVEIVAVVDARSDAPQFLNYTVVRSYDELPACCDAVIVTDLVNAQETSEQMIRHFGADRVLIPALLRVRLADQQEKAVP
jgi:DNA-binding MarR family transcriptional regulator